MPRADNDEATATAEDQDEAAAATPRPFWSGTLSFGLVSIPVSLFPASRRLSVPLRMLAPDGTPLARRYYGADDDKPLGEDDLVRGYELDDGSYVLLSDEELEAADPEKSRDIDLRLFVPVAEVDPIYFERGYVLASSAESTKAYRLLAKVMEDQGQCGIATFVMRESEYLIAIFAGHGVLHAQTLRFADEVRPVRSLELPEPQQASASLVKSFVQAIDRRTKKQLDTRELRDVQLAALREHLEHKRKQGMDVIHTEQSDSGAGPHAEIIDLMEVLKRSLRGEQVEAERPARSHRARSRNPKRPAKTRPSPHERARPQPRKRRAGRAGGGTEH